MRRFDQAQHLLVGYRHTPYRRLSTGENDLLEECLKALCLVDDVTLLISGVIDTII